MTRDPLSGLRPPKPVPELRARVLHRARRAAALRRAVPQAAASPFDRFVDRLWTSRRSRIAWLVAVLLLAVLNLTAGRGPGNVRGPSPSAGATAERLDFGGIGYAGLLQPRPEHTLASYHEPAAIEALGL